MVLNTGSTQSFCNQLKSELCFNCPLKLPFRCRQHSPMPPATDGAQRSSDASKGDAKQHESKTVRHIRWGMEEIFVLIDAKKVVENQVQRGRRSGSTFATDQTEHKWDLISSYCRQRGVDRGPVQCRKRWGNMLCDFRKIRAWESTNSEVDSFWSMRGELRKERKLPGLFHREVYDAIGGEELPVEAVPLSFIPAYTKTANIDEDHAAEQKEDDEKEETQESGPCTSPEDEYLADPEKSGQDDINTSTEKEDVETGHLIKVQVLSSPASGTRRKESPLYKTRGDSKCYDACKKRRLSSSQDEDSSAASRLIKVLERNNKMLHAQLEAQNQNIELERKQRKECNDSLIGILNKLTDAVTKIANKF